MTYNAAANPPKFINDLPPFIIIRDKYGKTTMGTFCQGKYWMGSTEMKREDVTGWRYANEQEIKRAGVNPPTKYDIKEKVQQSLF